MDQITRRLTESGSPLAPFRYPAFRTIWLAMVVSSLGTMIQSVGAQWLMTDLTQSHSMVALVQASTLLPIMVLGVPAGAIADNFDRRRVMLASQGFMLVASTLLAILAWQGDIGPGLLVLLTLAVGAGTALNAPAWQASVRAQVGSADLPQAISLNTIAFNLARSVGPALGGLLISLWSVSIAFTVNAASYLVMIVALVRWHPPRREPSKRGRIFVSIGQGISFCANSPPLRRVLLRGLVFGLFGGAGQALMAVTARDLLGGDEIDFGLMLGAFGIGSIVTALFVSSVRKRFGSEIVVSAASFALGVSLILLAEARSLPFAIVACFLAGGGWVGALNSLNVAMQLRSPDVILGRCLSIYQAVTFGAVALGAYGWGWVSDWQSLPFALYAAAAGLFASMLLRFVVPMPSRGEGRVDLDADRAAGEVPMR